MRTTLFLYFFTAFLLMGGAKGQVLKGKFVNIKTLSPEFVLDIKYATADNFLKQALVPWRLP